MNTLINKHILSNILLAFYIFIQASCINKFCLVLITYLYLLKGLDNDINWTIYS